MNRLPGTSASHAESAHRPHPLSAGLPLWAVGALITAGLLVYSQTHAFGWDEGYHLLAAQLIGAGKRPYLDFCFPQTPLAAYWNAAWMRVFGESWRTVHALAALCTSGAVMLAARFVLTRLPAPEWRPGAAIATAILIGANTAVVQFATGGQPYGFCLVLTVAAFNCAVLAVDRRGPLLSAAAGLLAAAAAAGSLLTAPVAPVLLLWILICNRSGSRLAKFAWFVMGSLISWAPVFWLFVQAPRQVFFNVIEYMLVYRPATWPGAPRHDFEVLISWVDYPQALVLGLLAAAGLLGASRNARARRWRSELYLCLWLAAALAVYVSCAHPTFPQYYLLAVPFLSVVAAAGLWELSLRLGSRPLWAVLAVAALVCGGLAKRLYEEGRDDFFWRDMEKVARQVEQVTPRDGALLASEEHVYFLTRHRPPSGMEVEDSHRISLPPADAALFHLVFRDELRKRMEAGAFDTVEICEEDGDRVRELGLERIYARSVEIAPCYVFWERIGGAARTSGVSGPIRIDVTDEATLGILAAAARPGSLVVSRADFPARVGADRRRLLHERYLAVSGFLQNPRQPVVRCRLPRRPGPLF